MPLPSGAHAGEQVHLGASLWDRGNTIIGLYGMWHGHPSNDRRLVTMDLGLVVSNDAIHFREPIPDFRMVPCHEEPETEGGLSWEPRWAHSGMAALAQGQGFENVGERTLFWYEVWNQGKVRLATWPRDRLGYYEIYRGKTLFRRSLLEAPHLISCPIRPGDVNRVYVNAGGLSEHSHLEVELCDEQFRRLPGYSGEDCIPLTESGFRQPVAWRGKSSLDELEQVDTILGGSS